ncbi:TetR/AcrR family transcriptional regulator [Paenibacillus sp. L3-i20]|uniref:TetR/AcrR family transcriptional regulator n=1 Tax=Paenibacillus sp. L3-i20 TaxID=2905833 RepID=UPI001EDD374D|nr:TetR/AcrR family transcriptional regulator [Paenibacillus sp. L3-i20]GKU76590.1 putative HTH-type transcriptional regulator YdgC [Paenibacillus sp. L3-i20]
MQTNKGGKGLKSRARIMGAAAYEFSNHGFHDTKVSSIVSRAGLTQPAFYLYFESKEAIFDELVTDFRMRLLTMTKDLRLSIGLQSGELKQQVLEAITTLFRFLAENPDLSRIGLFLAHDAEQFKEQAIKLVAGNLSAEQKAGYYRSELSMDIVAASILGAIERLTLSRLLPKISTPEAIAQEIVDLLMNGMMN